MLAMTMVMPMMLTLAVIMTVTPSGVFLCCCGIACIKLFTLFWILNTLMCAVPTYELAVGVFDRALDMALTNDGIWK